MQMSRLTDTLRRVMGTLTLPATGTLTLTDTRTSMDMATRARVVARLVCERMCCRGGERQLGESEGLG